MESKNMSVSSGDARPARVTSHAMATSQASESRRRQVTAWRREPLSEHALQRLRRRLDERERELRTKILDERTRVQDEAMSQHDEVGDLVDQAFVITQVTMERDLIDRCINQLDEIARTHDRIASGDIGICVDCDEPIEGDRLEANPVASRCTECQDVQEKVARINAR